MDESRGIARRPRNRANRCSFRLDADHADQLQRVRQYRNFWTLTQALEHCIAVAHWQVVQDQVAEETKIADKPAPKTKKTKKVSKS